MISEDEAYEEARRLHPEFNDWQPEDFERAESKQGVNWNLHLHLDAVVFRRASDPSLPDGEVIRQLRERGQSEQDAVHAVTRLLIEDIWQRLKSPGAQGGGKTSAAEPKLKLDAMSAELDRKIRGLLKPQ